MTIVLAELNSGKTRISCSAKGTDRKGTQKRALKRALLDPPWFRENPRKCFRKNGGDDETRTRDLCRDGAPSFGNSLKLRDTDGYQNRALEPQVTIIGP